MNRHYSLSFNPKTSHSVLNCDVFKSLTLASNISLLPSYEVEARCLTSVVVSYRVMEILPLEQIVQSVHSVLTACIFHRSGSIDPTVMGRPLSVSSPSQSSNKECSPKASAILLKLDFVRPVLQNDILRAPGPWLASMRSSSIQPEKLNETSPFL